MCEPTEKLNAVKVLGSISEVVNREGVLFSGRAMAGSVPVSESARRLGLSVEEYMAIADSVTAYGDGRPLIQYNQRVFRVELEPKKRVGGDDYYPVNSITQIPVE